jgi:hypothetical protein
LRTTNWPPAEDVRELAALVNERLSQVTTSIGGRLKDLGMVETASATLGEQARIPSPKNLAGRRASTVTTGCKPPVFIA